MGFRFFENSFSSNLQSSPKEMYEDLQQEFVNLQWDNTSTLMVVKEQEDIGSDKYNDIEVWIDSTVEDTTTGLKDSNDFNKLIFKDIHHRIKRGLMYEFDDNYWIVNNYSYHSGLVQQCGVRRCNNVLRIVDPLNGAVQTIPCCVDYDMASPSQQTNRYIITPNNHAVVIVQGNDLTLRLFKTNTRYMLSGRPFKLLSYQNAVNYSKNIHQTTLLYLDLYLDELHDKDSIENVLADNGSYDYSIKINSNDMSLPINSTGKLYADVQLNGEEVVRNVLWSSSNSNILSINENGEYEVKGNIGDIVTIVAELEGNELVKDTIEISISEEIENQPMVVIDPIFNTIRQFETIDFKVEANYNGEVYKDFDNLEVELNPNDRNYAQLIANDDGSYSLTGLKITTSPINIIVNLTNLTPTFEAEKVFEANVVSMMG